MNDWQQLVIDELKAIKQELGPIKTHVTQVRFTAVLFVLTVPAIFAIYQFWLIP